MIKIPNEAMTHSGRFHADDVFSAALLKIMNPEVNIVRSNFVPEGYTGLVFDLGDGEYDHHGERATERKNGVPYASFGLLWKKYGTNLVSEKEANTFDESFIQPLDFQDNNGGNNLLCRVITQANPKWDDAESNSNECFIKAVEIAKFILVNERASMHSTEHAESIVRQCLEKQKDGIVILPTGMPWKAILIPENVQYVIYPSTRGGYNAQAVPISIATQQCKIPFPEEWRGKKDELESITKINGINFCHIHGYLAGTDSLEAAVAICKKSMELYENNGGIV